MMNEGQLQPLKYVYRCQSAWTKMLNTLKRPDEEVGGTIYDAMKMIINVTPSRAL
jgi:hypothetical protein